MVHGATGSRRSFAYGLSSFVYIVHWLVGWCLLLRGGMAVILLHIGLIALAGYLSALAESPPQTGESSARGDGLSTCILGSSWVHHWWTRWRSLSNYAYP
jgi:hypothetical protein